MINLKTYTIRRMKMFTCKTKFYSKNICFISNNIANILNETAKNFNTSKCYNFKEVLSELMTRYETI